MRYSGLILSLAEQEIYTVESLVDYALDEGFFTPSAEADRATLQKRIGNALFKFAKKHFVDPGLKPDGSPLTPGKQVNGGWYGWRWMSALPENYRWAELNEHLHRFREGHASEPVSRPEIIAMPGVHKKAIPKTPEPTPVEPGGSGNTPRGETPKQEPESKERAVSWLHCLPGLVAGITLMLLIFFSGSSIRDFRTKQLNKDVNRLVAGGATLEAIQLGQVNAGERRDVLLFVLLTEMSEEIRPGTTGSATISPMTNLSMVPFPAL